MNTAIFKLIQNKIYNYRFIQTLNLNRNENNSNHRKNSETRKLLTYK